MITTNRNLWHVTLRLRQQEHIRLRMPHNLTFWFM